MSISCKEILGLASLEELKLVAGENGLDRSLRWVYVADSFDDVTEVINWIHGGELVLMSGIGLKGDLGKFIRFLKDIDAKGAAGLVVSIGPYISIVPDDIRRLGDALKMPIFELPWRIGFVDITLEISTLILMQEIEQRTFSNLLENILFSCFESEDEFKNIAKRYNFELLGSGLIGIADIDDFAGYLRTSKISDEKQIQRIKDDFKSAFLASCHKQQVKVLSMLRSDSIIFLMQIQNSWDSEHVCQFAKEVGNHIELKLNGISVSFGFGQYYTKLKDLHLSFEEAEKALHVAKREESFNNVCIFKDLGLYSILLDADRALLEKYYHNCFDILLEYDHINNASLLNTLETYLKESCNLSRTSKRMFLHRNTLKYRIEKIEQLLKCDLKSFKDCACFDLGFKIKNLLY